VIVDYTPESLSDLREIWNWNAKRHGKVHADKYVEFLQDPTDRLETDFARGRSVASHPELRYQLLRQRRSGHRHVVIYELFPWGVRILRFFHSAQDWSTRLK
jgi:plasmid stabilization system protein ParE